MIWYNYLAPTVNTPLDSKSIVESGQMEARILALGAGSMYHGYYDLEQRETFVNYEGLMKPVFNTIYIDLDDDETKGEKAWVDSLNLCNNLRSNNIDFTLYFSGNKGFHIGIHMHALGITEGKPKAELEFFVKTFLFGLKEIYPSVDTRIWNANRKFRAANSKHEKSGLYKTMLYPGRKVSNLSMDQIRELAKGNTPLAPVVHPASVGKSDFLLSIVELGKKSVGDTTYSGKKSEIKEVAVGLMIDDPSMKYRTEKKKPCITGMFESRNPNFNRHDIGMRIITDMHATGETLEQAESKLTEWATGVYSNDTDRVKDSIRMLVDTYSKPQDYRFGCYDEIRMAYCSAKCKIYKTLDPKKRAMPLDVTKKQAQENMLRDNPNLEKSEGELADELLMGFGTICKASGEYFKWIGTHWEMIDRERFEYQLNQLAISIYQNQATTKQIKSLIDQVKMKIQVAPKTNHFFSTSLNKFNFSDCTAVITQDDKGKIKLETKPHDPTDMLASCHPFPLIAEHNLPKSNDWEHYLKMRNEDLGPDGIRIIKQMLGAALIPFVPRIFFIEGQTNSGKSTLAMIIKKLLGESNISAVQPVLKNGGSDRFTWEPAIGKIANIVLELDKGVPLDVNTLKMVRDKSTITMDRKNKGHVPATLPFFHVYCCNQMPASLEGNSGALNNRVTMLHFKPGYLNGLGGTIDLARRIWETDAGSVLEAAREGLQDLIESGFKYYESDTSQESVKTWQKQTDSVALFFEDLRTGEWKKPALEGKEFERGSLFYAEYKEWAKDSTRKPLGKQAFYNDIEKKTGVARKARGEGGVRFDVRSLIGSAENEQSGKENAMTVERETNASFPSY